jgi:predicted nucleotidyltransferase
LKVLGIVVEYNPFHNGHLYHLEQSKKVSGADFVVCVMSGNFIQRGEPALINKWARTRAALNCGIDLVIELPVVYAMASAEYFAFGAIKILDSLGIVDIVCFGTESGNINELTSIAEILNNEPEEYKALLKEQLGLGKSYPKSRSIAISEYFKSSSAKHPDIELIMECSNNILGIEYLKALKRLNSKIVPMTIERFNNSYNNKQITGNISSATSIRKHIFESDNLNMNQTLKSNLPNSSSQVLEEEFNVGRGPLSSSTFESILLSLLRSTTAEKLKSLPYVSEGLENRFISAAKSSGNLKELLENICTKRYTQTRIQRILFSLLTGLTSQEFNTFNEYGGPQYARILGFNQKGRLMLSQINKISTIPIIIKTADFKSSCNPLLKRMLEIEAFSTDMYVLGYNNPIYKKAGQEYTQNIIIE